MRRIFDCPAFDADGEQVLTTYDNDYNEMQMDIRVYRLKKDSIRTFGRDEEELAVLLLSGNLIVAFDGQEQEIRRKDVFTQGPYAVHICAKEQVSIKAQTDAEILVACTHNAGIFPTRLYTPEDAPWKYSGVGKYGNTAKRRVNTIFDYENAPWSNMVLGEVLNDKGNWSGYPPHRHPQPEVYYFKFDRPEGFGASFIDDEVFKSKDGSFAAIPGGSLHPQAAAPGFMMYTCWMIRHMEGKPWLQTDRCEDKHYLWLNEEE